MGKAVLAGLALLASSGVVTVAVPAFMPPPGIAASGPSAADSDIPTAYLALIVKWADFYRIDWAVLAGVLKVECDFGRNCATSSTGAAGPAQFEPATWEAYGVDGDDDGSKDPLSPADAVRSAANYLHALGAASPDGVRAALCHYGGSQSAFQACMDGTQRADYADKVLTWTARYRASADGNGQPGNPFGAACRPVVTQPYGPTTLIGEPIVNGRRFHTGIDLACAEGTPVRSLTSGVAHVTTGWAPDPCCAAVGGGFGNNVVVEVTMRLGDDADAQRYFVRYGHLLGSIAVADGQVVRTGDLLGFEGSTGFSTGPHLHFEVDRNAPSAQASIDPSVLLALG